jgi:hypothetical protein
MYCGLLVCREVDEGRHPTLSEDSSSSLDSRQPVVIGLMQTKLTKQWLATNERRGRKQESEVFPEHRDRRTGNRQSRD